MAAPARDVLTVIWGGEQVSGTTFYGLTYRGGWKGASFPTENWPTDTQANESYLHGVKWEVIVWDASLPEWPTGAAWRQAVRDTLARLVSGGCVVSWLGLEGHFCDPPDLLSPESMSGGVLAAMTSTGDFDCSVDPDAPLHPLPDQVLLRLRRHAGGLADAT